MQTAPARPKAPQGVKQQARASIQQILNEPFEILANAGEQIAGTPSTPQDDVPQAQPQQVNQEEAKKKQARDSRHIQAFQEEIKEIKKLQEQREQKRAQLRMQEEQVKKQKQAEVQQQNRGFLEPIAKIKRGVLGGIKGMLKKKQNQVEMQKTPSN